MAPIMFKFTRATQTPEQHSLSVKSVEANAQRLTQRQKFSQIAKISNPGSASNPGQVFSGTYRSVANCSKLQNVYLNGKFIGRNFCIRF